MTELDRLKLAGMSGIVAGVAAIDMITLTPKLFRMPQTTAKI